MIAKAKHHGFSLLEAIVALLLVTMVSMASFSWVNNLLFSVEKLETNAQRNLVKRNVSEFLSGINVMSMPNGEQRLGGMLVSWQAQLMEPIQKGKTINGGTSPFELGLYRVEVRVDSKEGERVTFELIQVGYKALLNDPF